MKKFYCLRLYRTVKRRVRYYTLRIYGTLEGEYLVEKEYGSVENKKPTRIIKQYYLDFESALNAIEKQYTVKYKKGYRKSIG